MKNLDNKSKYLSLLLRHKPENANLKLDKEGWCNVDELLNNTDFTMEELEAIVASDNKQRYSFKEDKNYIRANQGHSLKVDLKLKQVIPPAVLYHGTVDTNKVSILRSGLDKGSRHHVHLTDNLETARTVGGRRKGKVIIFSIDTTAMRTSNYKFYQSENGVYLTDSVPAEFLSVKE